MFLVPTVVRPSPIAGHGVFSPFPIRAGTLIWEFTTGVDWRFTATELDSIPEPYQAALRRWCYRSAPDLYVLCGDSAKFMNHSDDPTCDERGGVTLTRRDITAGEELTCDYGEFDLDAMEEGLNFSVSPRSPPSPRV